nr:PREDICTED: uncharacterized protein LOC105667369 [Linepithema humile]
MFWKLRIQSTYVYAMKIKNVLHITRASIDYTTQASSTVSLYIRHQRQLQKICTFSNVEREKCTVRLDLTFDNEDDMVEFFLDGLGLVRVSGSETLPPITPFHISHLNVITIRQLESKDFEHDADSCSNIQKESLPKDETIKQICNNVY